MLALGNKDFKQIEALHYMWMELEGEHKFKELMMLCTPDVRFIVPGEGEMIGKEEITSWYEGRAHAMNPIKIKKLDVKIGKTMAYKTAHIESTQSSKSAKNEEKAGVQLWVLHKLKKDWKVAVVMWTYC